MTDSLEVLAQRAERVVVAVEELIADLIARHKRHVQLLTNEVSPEMYLQFDDSRAFFWNLEEREYWHRYVFAEIGLTNHRGREYVSIFLAINKKRRQLAVLVDPGGGTYEQALAVRATTLFAGIPSSQTDVLSDAFLEATRWFIRSFLFPYAN